ncbi:Heat shock protein 68 [Orobanche hederae]
MATSRGGDSAQLTGNTKSSWSLSNKWAGLARPFSTKPAGSDVMGIDLGTTNSCVSVMEGKFIEKQVGRCVWTKFWILMKMIVPV